MVHNGCSVGEIFSEDLILSSQNRSSRFKIDIAELVVLWLSKCSVEFDLEAVGGARYGFPFSQVSILNCSGPASVSCPGKSP